GLDHGVLEDGPADRTAEPVVLLDRGESLDDAEAQAQPSDRLSRFPSGSRNHATLVPPGALQTPRSSCGRPGKRSKTTPFWTRPRSTVSRPWTCHPSTV